MYLPVCAGVFAVDGFGLCTSHFSLLCAWLSTKPTVELALSFALHGRPTALNFGAFRCGITPPTNDSAASSGTAADLRTALFERILMRIHYGTPNVKCLGWVGVGAQVS